MKKVLVIAYYFPPIASTGTLRTVKFVKYLRDFGWEPIVLTVDNPYVKKDLSFDSMLPEDIRIIRTKAKLPADMARYIAADGAKKPDNGTEIQNDRSDKQSYTPKKSFAIVQFLKNVYSTLFFTPDEYKGWYKFACQEAVKVVKDEDIDMIFTSGPPNTCFQIAERVSKLTNIPLVSDFRDPWNTYGRSYNPFSLKIKDWINARSEKRIIRNSKAVVVVTGKMKEMILNNLPETSADKISVITNGFDLDDIQKSGFDTDVEVEMSAEAESKSDKIKIVHFGNMPEWRKPDEFFKALSDLVVKRPEFRDRLTVEFVGNASQSFREKIRNSGIEGLISQSPRCSYLDSLKKLHGADIGLIIQADLPDSECILTAKLFDYLGLGLPVLALTGKGELKNFLEDHKVGIACSGTAISGTLEKMVDEYEVYRGNVGKLDNEIFDRKSLTGNLAKLFDSLIN